MKVKRLNSVENAQVTRYVETNKNRISETAMSTKELMEAIERDLCIKCSRDTTRKIAKVCEVTLRYSRSSPRAKRGTAQMHIARELVQLIQMLDVHGFHFPISEKLINIANKQRLNGKQNHENNA